MRTLEIHFPKKGIKTYKQLLTICNLPSSRTMSSTNADNNHSNLYSGKNYRIKGHYNQIERHKKNRKQKTEKLQKRTKTVIK